MSLSEILKRHEKMGSPNFAKIKAGRVENSAERYEFLQNFYEYVMADDGLDAGLTYTSWLQFRKGKNWGRKA